MEISVRYAQRRTWEGLRGETESSKIELRINYLPKTAIALIKAAIRYRAKQPKEIERAAKRKHQYACKLGSQEHRKRISTAGRKLKAEIIIRISQ